jgi:hypothetical protein
MTNERKVEDTRPWWREGMVWLVIGGPLVVVVAGTVTAFIAWHGRDPEIERSETVQQRVQAKDPLAPALGARNHAVTPTESRP